MQADANSLNAGATATALGGTSFDTAANGASPGSAAVFLGSNPGTVTTHNAVVTSGVMAKNATSVQITTKSGSAVAVSGQTLTFAGANNNPGGVNPNGYTVTSDSTPLGHAFPDVITFTPGLQLLGVATTLKAGVAVTIHDTVGTPTNQIVTGSATQGTNQMTISGNFTGTSGESANVAYLNSGIWTDGLGFTAAAANSTSGGSLSQVFSPVPGSTTNWSYDVVVMNGATPVSNESVSASASATSSTASNTITWGPPATGNATAFSGDTVNIYGRSILPNNIALLTSGIAFATGTFTDDGSLTPNLANPAPNTSATVVTGTGSSATLNVAYTGLTEPTGSVMVTLGSTNITPAAVYQDTDVQIFGGSHGNSNGSCFNDLGNSVGNFAPTGATIVGSTTTTHEDAAIGLEAPPGNWSGNITYPPMTSPGWLDNNGLTANPNPTSTIAFSTPKDDLFDLAGPTCTNCYVFGAGKVTGEYALPATAKMAFAANGMVTCSIAQLEAIQSNTGPDAVNTSPYYISPAEQAHAQPEYNYCDGGPNNAAGVTPSQALTNLITLELNSTANVYASDGSPLSAIWEIQSGAGESAFI